MNVTSSPYNWVGVGWVICTQSPKNVKFTPLCIHGGNYSKIIQGGCGFDSQLEGPMLHFSKQVLVGA